MSILPIVFTIYDLRFTIVVSRRAGAIYRNLDDESGQLEIREHAGGRIDAGYYSAGCVGARLPERQGIVARSYRATTVVLFVF
jgi:hypothetical protein